MWQKINSRKFYELAKTAITNSDFGFKDLQERSYLKYWSRLTIVKIENGVKNYGKDLT